MPVGLVAVKPAEGPGQPIPSQPRLNIMVMGDVNRIIEVDKTIAQARQEGPDHQHKQQQANDGCLASRKAG